MPYIYHRAVLLVYMSLISDSSYLDLGYKVRLGHLTTSDPVDAEFTLIIL